MLRLTKMLILYESICLWCLWCLWQGVQEVAALDQEEAGDGGKAGEEAKAGLHRLVIHNTQGGDGETHW